MIPAKTFQRYASDPQAFRADLTIDSNGSAKRFDSIMADWQRADFAALDPALQVCNGRAKLDPNVKMRAFYERPRGASKTSDIAVMCVWALVFSTRPLKAYVYASDKDQSKLLLDAVQTICRLNPWLNEILSVEAHRVVNIAKGHPGEGGVLSCEASQIGSSFGTLGSLYVADELTHWPDNAEGLWHSIVSSAAKRSDAVLFTISNAGFCGSWQHGVRETARMDESWNFSRLESPPAWISPQRIEEQRRMLPRLAFERLVFNQWSSTLGDALTEQDINAAFSPDHRPITFPDSSLLFIAGADLGLTRDNSAVVILAVESGGRSPTIALASVKVWRPIGGKQKIEIGDIEKYLLAADEQLGLENIAADPWQAELLCQRLEQDSEHRRRNQKRRFGAEPWVRTLAPTAATLRAQASLVIESFHDRRFRFFPHEPFRQDLLKLRCEETSYGFRLSSPRDSTGHGDIYSAFANALMVAHEIAGKKQVVAGAVTFDGFAESVSFGNPRLGQVEQDKDLPARLAQLDFENEAKTWEDEMRVLSRPNSDQEPFRKFMADRFPQRYMPPDDHLF